MTPTPGSLYNVQSCSEEATQVVSSTYAGHSFLVHWSAGQKEQNIMSARKLQPILEASQMIPLLRKQSCDVQMICFRSLFSSVQMVKQLLYSSTQNISLD